MKKFKDINTRTQLLLGFGVVFVLIVTLSMVAAQLGDKMALRTENLYNHPLKVRRALATFENSMHLMRVEFRNIILSKDEKKWNAAKQNYQIEKSHAEEQLKLLSDSYLGDLKDIDSLKMYFLKWNYIQENDLKKSTTDKIDTVLVKRVFDGDIKFAREQLFNKIVFIEDFAQNKADQFYDESLQLNQVLNRQFFLFVIAVLAVVLFFIFYLSKLINNPLKEITRATTLFMAGDRGVRSVYSSKNEFGALSNSFNKMAEIVETELVLNDHSASLTDVMLKEDDAHKFCSVLLESLISHTNSQMGIIYLLNSEKTDYEKFECIGLDSEGCKPISAKQPEGIFGLALTHKKISHIKNIPSESKFSFNTVSGNLKPQEIITIPIFSGEEVIAFISIFNIYKYSLLSERLIETIFNTLTSRMIGILAYKTTIEFSEKLEEQNIELDNQKNELMSMANELTEQNIELEQQKHQLGEVSRLKTNFLSNMSHELRTPLNSVIALSGVLNRRLLDKIAEEEHNYIGVIERNGKHLLNLINDILDISLIESGKVEIEKNSFYISKLVNELVEMIKPQADQKMVGLNFVEPKDKVTIESDYSKCLHILQNIIGNAVKFTEKGSVDITIKEKEEHVYVTVRDTGIGISKENFSSIFDEFRQADGSNSRKFGGTGLGLAIAKKYTKLIGGKIKVESELGKGSIFTLMLPIKSAYTEMEVESITPNIISSVSLPEKVVAKGKTVLLVEDTDAIVVQMKDILEEENYVVAVANNGIEALKYLEKNIPDAVILDLMMPAMDGFETLQRIRNNKQTANLPVLILTSKILNKEELLLIKNNNAHQLIQKGNISKESLLEAIMLLMIVEEEGSVEIEVEVLPMKVIGKPKILAIEDNLDNMLALKALLGEDCTFIEAFDGFEGIEKAKEHNPQLIFMDIAMPRKNGFETLSEIRKNPKISHIPVIVVTSSAMKGDKNYFLDFGFNGYVSKPINQNLLIKEMNDWLIILNK